MRILVADDEELVRFSLISVLEDILEDMPTIIEAGNGRELADLARDRQPDIGFVDIRMPKMDGLQAIAEARESSPRTLWVIVSGHGDFDNAREALKLGVEDFLVKPVDPGEVKILMDRLAAGIREMQLQDSPFDEGGGSLAERALEVMNLRYRENIGIAQVAEELGVTANYLSTVFKKEIGTGFTQKLTDLRLSRACSLLSRPNANIGEIARSLGYQSSRHFSRIFKDRYGITPSQWTEQA